MTLVQTELKSMKIREQGQQSNIIYGPSGSTAGDVIIYSGTATDSGTYTFSAEVRSYVSGYYGCLDININGITVETFRTDNMNYVSFSYETQIEVGDTIQLHLYGTSNQYGACNNVQIMNTITTLVEKDIKRVVIGQPSRLPSEYQEVEWIKSNGNCILNTGYSPSGSYLKIDLKMKYNSTSAALGDTPFVYGYTQSNFCFLCRNGNSPYCWEFGNGNTAKVTSVVVQSNTDYTISVEANNGTQTIDINGTTTSGSCGNSLSTGNIPIFCRYANNRYEYFATDMTLYYFKIYSSQNTMERELIPCYRKSDNVIGMYDIVNDVFYTNSGTGTFAKGANIGGEKQIRPVGWRPGANTIAYWKLETDGADYSGNGYNLTLNGITFQTSGNLKYAEVTTASKFCYQPGVFTQANVGTGDFCVNFWFNPVNPGSKCPVMFLDSPDAYPYPGVNVFFDPNNKSGLGDGIIFRVQGRGQYLSATTASSLYNGWHNVVYTRLNGVCYAYIDEVSVITPYSDNTDISQLGGYNAYVIGGNGNSQIRGNTGAKFSNMICENIGWSNSEVSDYYNLTKGNYGL